MSRNLAIVLTLGIGAMLAADAPKDEAAKKDLEKLRGAWVATTYDVDGKPTPKAELKTIKLVIKGDKSTLTKGTRTDHATYKLDPTQKPKTIDILVADGPYKGKTLPGIYELTDDTFKIALAYPEKERPKGFVAKEGVIFEVWKREKAAAAAPAAPIFPDMNLEAAVRAVLQHSKGELTDANLANVYVLEASGKNIASLKGLEKCKNLALLKLTKNQVQDLAPLKELTNIQSLDLADNKIADVTPLGGLNKLQYLELSNNQVANVAPLQGLAALSALYLSGNKITDITPLSGLTRLASLSLGRNQIRDLTALMKVTKLSTLDLSDNQIEDLNPLTKQTELSLLILQRNKITDLAPLVAMAKADAEGAKRFAPYLRLYLQGNPLSDAAKSGQLTALKGYGVRIEF